ncbi:MAG: hypothetical protein HDT36_04715 [Clostridiales bacterium]|nr:hypothetical protein [Clostridiales bacterium]
MKKKLIICLLLVVCIVCLLSTLTACSSNSINYVESSFDYEVSYKVDEYLTFDDSEIESDFSFKIKSTATREFEIKYVVAFKYSDTGEVAFTREYERSGSMNHGETKTIYGFNSVYKRTYPQLWNNTTLELVSVEINDVKTHGANELYDGYAIGFGIVSGLILIGLSVVLILDKVKKKN